MTGRALRAHRAVMSRDNSPADAADRVRRRAAGEQAHREMMERFGSITADNAREAIAWQEARIRSLIGHP